jgi:RecB family endonuclease NucS
MKMEWSSFFGALAGGVVGVLIILGGFLAWDEFNRRKEAKIEPQKIISLDDILESHLEQHIVQHFDTLFPGWRIYALNINADSSTANVKPIGIRYRTEAGEIDILCVDSEDNFVVVELKRNKAPDKVVAQTDRYMTWVEKTLAQANQQVRGLIIAKSFDKHLAYILAKRSNINLWTYNWQLEFDKNVVQKTLKKGNLMVDKSDEIERLSSISN